MVRPSSSSTYSTPFLLRKKLKVNFDLQNVTSFTVLFYFVYLHQSTSLTGFNQSTSSHIAKIHGPVGGIRLEKWYIISLPGTLMQSKTQVN